jgi:hypothetical protein
MARFTWALIDEELVEHITAKNYGDAKVWLFYLMETLSHEDFVKATLWVIWTARRKAIHEEIYQSTLSISSFINSFLGDFSLSQAASKTQVKTVHQHHQQRQSHVKWTAPQAGWCKVNVEL